MSELGLAAFKQGVAYACATFDRLFDQPSMAAEVLRTAFRTTAELKAAKVDEYDAKVCRRLLREYRK